MHGHGVGISASWSCVSPPATLATWLTNRVVSFGSTVGYNIRVTAVPLGDARDHLSEYVSDVERTHHRVTITRHGRPLAVLISPDDLAELEETVAVFTTPGALEAIREGQADAAAGRFADNEDVQARYRVR
jgi:antitoxin YefM